VRPHGSTVPRMTVDPNTGSEPGPESDIEPDIEPDIESDLELGEGFEDDEDFEDLAEMLGLPEHLPPIWLPPIEELASAARESTLLRRVGELVAWVGDRREVTEEGDLTPADAAEAAGTLGVSPAELLLCWETALAADLIVVTEENTAETNPDFWPTNDDEEDIGTWAAGFTQVLSSLIFDTELADEQDLDFDGAGALALPLFLARENGVEVAELQEIMQSMETEELADDAPWHAWVAAHGHPVDVLLNRLADHGAATVDDGVARLTPLAMLIMREELADGGIEVPLLPPPADMTAEDLLTVVGGRTGEELSDLATTWLSTRDPAAAATELLAAAATAEPGGRFYASTILADLPAVPWETVLDEPSLRPYARIAMDQPPDAADSAWLLLDAISASTNAMGELSPEAVALVGAETLPEGAEEEVLAAAWRLPHPLAFEVLTLIGANHPDRKVAKAARTAAHKARSAAV
jgi:hypothetical protein